MSCGKVEHVRVGQIVAIEDGPRELTDYGRIRHPLELIGLCPQCRREAWFSEKAQQKGRKGEMR